MEGVDRPREVQGQGGRDGGPRSGRGRGVYCTSRKQRDLRRATKRNLLSGRRATMRAGSKGEEGNLRGREDGFKSRPRIVPR